METPSDYKKVIDELAYLIMYKVIDNHGLSELELIAFNNLLNEEIEITVDSISSMFNRPKDIIDIDVANAMAELNHEDILSLKRERKRSTIH